MNPVREEMKLRLKEKCLTVEGWGKAQGYKKGVVWKVVSRYVGKGRKPGGLVGNKIIEELEAESGMKLIG